MIEESLYAYITADTNVKAALGGTRSDKTSGVFPDLAPEQCLTPYIVFLQDGGEPLAESFAGTGALQSARWRFSCYGSSKKQAKNLANVLKKSLLSMDGSQSGGTEVHGAWFRGEHDEIEPMPLGTIRGAHLDFDFNFLDTE